MVIPDAVRTLDRDLREIFGNRMHSLIAYASAEGSSASPTLAVVASIAADDLRACASKVAAWHEAGVATPLILETHEFGRSLDTFPFEFGAILADHVVVSGANPFTGLRVDPADARRACEIQARGHLLHLREGYIETQGRSDRLAALITRSSGPLAALIRNVARLSGGRPVADVLTRVAAIGRGPLSSDDARNIFPEYLTAMERLTNEIDRWSEREL